MRLLHRLLLGGSVIAAGFGSAAGTAAGQGATQLRVGFMHPERFSDASLDSPFARGADEPALARLKAHLESLGARYLKPGQRLTIDILDVDLAGRMEWLRRFIGEVRVLRDIDPPHIVLRYSLAEGGRVALRGEEAVTDLDYLSQPTAYFRSDSLRYEKTLLDDWFRDRIVERRPAPR